MTALSHGRREGDEMIDLYVIAVFVLLVLEIFTIGFVVGFWFAEKGRGRK